MEFPVGYRFHPTDSELVGVYLYNKIFQPSLLSGNTDIRDFDLYGSLEPSDVWTLFGGDSLLEDDPSLFFFTILKKKSSKSRRVCRTVASGTWAGEDGGETIQFGNAVAIKKRFRYENPRSPQDRAWIMHEYSFQSQDMVICRLKRNKSAAGQRGLRGHRKRKSKEEHIEEDRGVSVEPKRPRTEDEEEEFLMKFFEDLPSLADASDSFTDAIPVDNEQNTAESSHSAKVPIAVDDSGWADLIALDDLTGLQYFDVPFTTQPTLMLEADR